MLWRSFADVIGLRYTKEVSASIVRDPLAHPSPFPRGGIFLGYPKARIPPRFLNFTPSLPTPARPLSRSASQA